MAGKSYNTLLCNRHYDSTLSLSLSLSLSSPSLFPPFPLSLFFSGSIPSALHLAFKAQRLYHQSSSTPPLSVINQLCSTASHALKICNQELSSENNLHLVREREKEGGRERKRKRKRKKRVWMFFCVLHKIKYIKHFIIIIIIIIISFLYSWACF